MKITVHAKPKKKKAYVLQLSSTQYVVAVHEPAIDGRANQAIIKSLSQYFKVTQSDISLVSGHTSQLKIFDVPEQLAGFEPLPKQKPLF